MVLASLDVLILDCQASGATPAHGDLLEIAWGISGADGLRDVESHWIVPRSSRPIPAPVRKIIGWSAACLVDAISPADAWARLRARATEPNMPTLIHWAQFERPFLRVLAAGEPPFDIRCLNAVAARLFPDLPRTNLRAHSGYLGHSPEQVRRARGHVEATAFAWRAMLPHLEREGVRTWDDLAEFLERPHSRKKDRVVVFPFPPEKRKLLPDVPGVYRFTRKSGDVLYVGKAASLKKRVASHFTTKRGKAEQLEMLTQAHDVTFTPTATAVEAALFEVEEIHRLHPPYNVHLRAAPDRRAWFASRDYDSVREAPDARHRVGPLPSARAVAGLAAMTQLLAGATTTPALRGAALGVPESFAPNAAMFDDVWRTFAPTIPLLHAGRALHPLRDEEHEVEPEGWTPERVRRWLVRTLAGEALLVRRARLLCLLADARVTFRDGGRDGVLGEALARPRTLHARQASFDARAYNRLRVLATELRRVHGEGAPVEIRVGAHRLPLRDVFAGL